MRWFVGLIPLLAAAGDFSGIWVGQFPGRNGEPVDIAFKLAQKGGELTGKLYGDYQSFPVTEAVVSGNAVTFVVIVQEQAGNQINETRLRFTGKLEAGVLELTRDREASTNAANRGGVQLRDGPKQTFRLKRLF